MFTFYQTSSLEYDLQDLMHYVKLIYKDSMSFEKISVLHKTLKKQKDKKNA